MKEKDYKERASLLDDRLFGYPANDFGKGEDGDYNCMREEIEYFKGMERIAYMIRYYAHDDISIAQVQGMIDAIKFIFEELFKGENK